MFTKYSFKIRRHLQCQTNARFEDANKECTSEHKTETVPKIDDFPQNHHPKWHFPNRRRQFWQRTQTGVVTS